MKTFRLAVCSDDIAYIKTHQIKGRVEVVFGREYPVMLADARAFRTTLKLDIWNKPLTDKVLRLCRCIEEACQRAIDCECKFPSQLEYRGHTCVINQELCYKLTERSVQLKLEECTTLISCCIKTI